MSSRRNVLGHLLLTCGLALTLLPLHGIAQHSPEASAPVVPSAAEKRDGSHDFDFAIGTWKTQLKRLVRPLTGSTTWVELEGTTVVRKVWDGRANLAELKVDTADGPMHVLSLRLYNPRARQWSLNTANSSGGTLSVPTVGEFKNGRGEFYDQEEFEGRTILVRNIWSDITADSCRFEQSFSDDGGKTWEVNWIAVDTRVKDEPPDLAKAIRDYDQATFRKDTVALGDLVTDDYLLVNSDSTLQDKQSYLADFTVPGFKLDPYVMEEPVLKMWGDTALTAGRLHLAWTQDGKRQNRLVRIAHLWAKDDGRWRLTYSQLTRVP
jgi:ketosteroid isomerase-like protein